MKKFDCVKFQRDARDKMWNESGETIEGFFKYIDGIKQKNQWWIELTKRKMNSLQFEPNKRN